MLDEAIANWTSFDALSINHADSAVNSPSLLSARIPINDHNKQEEPVAPESSPEPAVIVDPETIPEPLTADDLESCELAIDQFGEDLVANIMSVKVKCRQNGLNQLNALIASTHVEENQSKQTKKFIHASILMIQEAIMDSREFIFNRAIQSWKHIQGKYLTNRSTNTDILTTIDNNRHYDKAPEQGRSAIVCLDRKVFFSRFDAYKRQYSRHQTQRHKNDSRPH